MEIILIFKDMFNYFSDTIDFWTTYSKTHLFLYKNMCYVTNIYCTINYVFLFLPSV